MACMMSEVRVEGGRALGAGGRAVSRRVLCLRILLGEGLDLELAERWGMGDFGIVDGEECDG
jgi:hypothetical protein